MVFKANARDGNPFCSIHGEQVTIPSVARKLTQESTQSEALQELGISYEQGCFEIVFIEIGKPYAEPEGDRTKVLPEKREEISVKVPLPNLPPCFLDITLDLTPFVREGVNFYGLIMVKTPSSEARYIPMTGRGTAALEGREVGDAHAGIATGAACATFQQRCALVLATAAAAGVSDKDIDVIGSNLASLNDVFHGRRDILDYTVKAAKVPSKDLESYTAYMISRYPEEERSPLLKSIVKTGYPPESYYKKVTSKLTPEELEKDNK